jgi:DNA-binding GntR family transcriptional regulator
MTKVARLCEAITARIESGDWRAGDRLPSEAQLATDHALSVGTVQKALARLAHAGLVSREHGRGTFVSATLLGADDVDYLRFRDAKGTTLPHFVHLRSVRRDRRLGPWTGFLGADAPCVRISRTISVAGRFELAAEFWLRDADFAPIADDERRALEGNLRVLLGRRLALPAIAVDQSIRFERLPAPIAARLGRDPAAPGFVMELRGRTLRDRPLFFQRVYAGPFSDSLMVVR